MSRVSIQTDPRCRKLNELTARYHQLFRQLGEKYILRLSRESGFGDDLTYSDFVFLSVVGDSDQDAVSMASVSRKLGINPSTATRRVTKLLANGLITKSNAADDDRRYDIRLTDAGRSVVEKMSARLFSAVQQTYAQVTEEEMQTVYRYLDKCIAQLNALVDSDPS